MVGNMKLGTKLVGGFALVAALSLVVGWLGVSGLMETGEAFDACLDVEFPLVDASMESVIALVSARDLSQQFAAECVELCLQRAGFATRGVELDRYTIGSGHHEGQI